MPKQPEPPKADVGAIEAGAPDRIHLRLTKPHPLIHRTLQEEENRKKPDYGYARYVQVVDFHASKKQIRMALAILDRLFKALEEQGFQVVLDNPVYGRGGTYARKGRDQCAVRVDEVDERIVHEMTAKEKADHEQYGRKPPKWDVLPTGQFTLNPGGKVDLSNEEAFSACLARTIALIEQKVAEARENREARERYEREEARRQHLRHEEEERIKAFGESARSLEHYQVLVQYIEEVRRHGVVPNNQRRENQTLEEWLAWAEAQAQSYHPLA
jgi:hypothetical protein